MRLRQILLRGAWSGRREATPDIFLDVFSRGHPECGCLVAGASLVTIYRRILQDEVPVLGSGTRLSREEEGPGLNPLVFDSLNARVPPVPVNPKN